MAHWSDNYIGLPYVRGEADCARLCSKVRREHFKQNAPEDIDVNRCETRLGRVGQMSDLIAEYGLKTDNPSEGDVVLMLCRARPSHIGIYCVVDGEPCVLHAMENAKMVVRHKIRELDRSMLSVEGYYKWK